MCACSFALVHALPAQRSASSLDGDLQQDRSGQRDSVRFGVSRPRNHFASSKGLTMLGFDDEHRRQVNFRQIFGTD